MSDTLKSITKNKENNSINDTNSNDYDIDNVNINDNVYNQAVSLFADFLLRY